MCVWGGVVLPYSALARTLTFCAPYPVTLVGTNLGTVYHPHDRPHTTIDGSTKYSHLLIVEHCLQGIVWGHLTRLTHGNSRIDELIEVSVDPLHDTIPQLADPRKDIPHGKAEDDVITDHVAAPARGVATELGHVPVLEKGWGSGREGGGGWGGGEGAVAVCAAVCYVSLVVGGGRWVVRESGRGCAVLRECYVCTM